MAVFVTPERPDRLITELWAWISKDPHTGLEGICSIMSNGTGFQAVTSSKDAAEKLRPMVEKTSQVAGVCVRLVCFKPS